MRALMIAQLKLIRTAPVLTKTAGGTTGSQGTSSDGSDPPPETGHSVAPQYRRCGAQRFTSHCRKTAAVLSLGSLGVL